MMYTEQELIRIAKRENNNKRPYLVINQLQGKHIPVSPTKALTLFQALAEQVSAACTGERLLVIGFAETATAIGAALAVHLDAPYLQTTREDVTENGYLIFSESHSHAVEQRLVAEGLAQQLAHTDRVVFAEDEVTTGNTILKLTALLRQLCGRNLPCSAASLVNGMDEDARQQYAQENLSLHYLVKTDHSGYSARAEGYRGDGVYEPCGYDSRAQRLTVEGWVDARQLTQGSCYAAACRQLCRQVRDALPNPQKQRVLVLGTEEFMYPALLLGQELESSGAQVRFHATSRSPIAVSSEADYPLHTRWELRSFYDASRVTYVYDLEPYDQVVVITDAQESDRTGEQTLLHALRRSGNQTITLVRWCR